MALYVTTNGDGLPTGFYDSRLAAAPEGAQVVTPSQYQQLLAAPNTTTFIAGVIGSFTPGAGATPTAPQQAIAALGTGLAIVSTSHPGALNGTYALDTLAMSLAADLAAQINANSGAFPGSVSTWSWPDEGGNLHVFPSAASFLAFQAALADYRLALYAVIWGVTTTLPATSVTIA